MTHGNKYIKPMVDNILTFQAGSSLRGDHRSYWTWWEEVQMDDPGSADLGWSDEPELSRDVGPNDTDSVLEGAVQVDALTRSHHLTTSVTSPVTTVCRVRGNDNVTRSIAVTP